MSTRVKDTVPIHFEQVYYDTSKSSQSDFDILKPTHWSQIQINSYWPSHFIMLRQHLSYVNHVILDVRLPAPYFSFTYMYVHVSLGELTLHVQWIWITLIKIWYMIHMHCGNTYLYKMYVVWITEPSNFFHIPHTHILVWDFERSWCNGNDGPP